MPGLMVFSSVEIFNHASFVSRTLRNNKKILFKFEIYDSNNRFSELVIARLVERT